MMQALAQLTEQRPDIGRVLCALDCQRPDRVPNFESFVARNVREAIFGCPLPDGLAGELIYRPRLNYDFVYLVPRYHTPPVYSRIVRRSSDGREWVDQHSGLITSRDDLERYREYPEPDEPLDLAEIEAACAAVKRQPGRLGVGALLPSCPFTEIGLVMGFENFSLALYEDFELCHDIVKKFGEVGIAAAKQLAASEIDFVFFGDDCACGHGLMISPEMMRNLFFPYYSQYIAILRDAGKPVVFHSDGDIHLLLDDFVEAGLSGVNPIEPAAMDIAALQRQYAGRLAFCGNIDVDLLSRGTPDAVTALTRRTLEILKPGGGFLLGSSNSICDYVQPENYLAMLRANAEFGRD